MSAQFFSRLSQNYVELLEDDEYYDITIEVGKDHNVKIFRAHTNILCYRSPYLRRTLASSKKINDGALTHIKLPNISPENFQIILRYIYGGILSLDGQDTSNVLKILIAANELLLQELIDYLQKYLIEDKLEWMEQHFELIHQTSFQSHNLQEIQNFCTSLMAKSPEKIFKSFDFLSLPEKSLISLIKRDDLQMKEVEIWDHVLKWGLAQNSTLTSSDPDTWSDDDFKTMENTLKPCLPLIRFFSFSSVEFSQKVRPYQKFLNHQLYEDLLNSYLDPNIVKTDNISLPRNIKTTGIIDSKIVDLDVVSTISRLVDKVDINNKFSHFRELYLSYKFELLLRGSEDGFTPKIFHELCDNNPHTITFIKVKGTDEIIGGYNPLKWESSKSWGKTKDSFIFSFKNKENKDKFFKDVIISDVKNIVHATVNHPECGPKFGDDLIIESSNETTDYNTICCKKARYDKMIRDTEEKFSIEDYEVFQIVKNRCNILY